MRRLLVALIGITMVLSACTGAGKEEEKDVTKETVVDIRIGCSNYPSSYAKAALLNALMVEKGYTAELVIEDTDQMWNSLESGRTDVVLSSWVPSIDTSRQAELGPVVKDLGTNCRNLSNGIFVPRYTLIGFLSELKAYGEEFQHTIYVCKESDVTASETRSMLALYDLDDFQIEEISYEDLDQLLEEAISNKKWIAVALWTPNGNISEHGLRQLKDTLGCYTSRIDTHTLVHEDFDRPKIEDILNNYYIRHGELNELIQLLEENKHNPEAVTNWLADNEQVVERLELGELGDELNWMQ